MSGTKNLQMNKGNINKRRGVKLPPLPVSKKPMKGRSITLIHTNDEYTNLKPGDKGTVHHVDDALHVHVNWENGSTLAMIPGVDKFKIE